MANIVNGQTPGVSHFRRSLRRLLRSLRRAATAAFLCGAPNAAAAAAGESATFSDLADVDVMASLNTNSGWWFG